MFITQKKEIQNYDFYFSKSAIKINTKSCSHVVSKDTNKIIFYNISPKIAVTLCDFKVKNQNHHGDVMKYVSSKNKLTNIVQFLVKINF